MYCRLSSLVIVATAGIGCASGAEPARVALPVLVDGSGMGPTQSDLGYEVRLSEARLVVQDLVFAVAGELHARPVWQRVWSTLVPSAHAHPGHYQGGSVTGELQGRFILDFLAGGAAALGVAELLVGSYDSAGFVFGRGRVEEGLAPGDPLLGHTAWLAGEAARDGLIFPFSITLDAPEDRQLVGAPFDVEVAEASPALLQLEMKIVDPLEGDTLFDGVDFAALAASGGGRVALGPEQREPAWRAAYEDLRRTFMTHDHFGVSGR